MTVSLVSDTSSQLQDAKLHILREETELLRSIRDQLTASNVSLQSERDQLLDLKKQSEIEKANCLYKIQKLEFNACRLEAENLSSSMIEDITAFDSEIFSANESVLMKMHEINEFERNQFIDAIRRLSVALQQSIENSKQLESQIEEFHKDSKASGIEVQQQHEKLNSEKSKLKGMLKSAKDELIKAQAVDSERKARIYELETEVEIMKEQLRESNQKKRDQGAQQLKKRLDESLRANTALQKQIERLHAVESENSKLQEELRRMKQSVSLTMDASIGRIKSTISSCDRTLTKRTTRKPNIQVTTITETEEEHQETLFNDDPFEDSDNLTEPEKAPKLKDPNWSDLEEANCGRKKNSRKRKQQERKELSTPVWTDNNPNPKSSQPRKLFADRAKSQMFTNSPGLSSIDHPFTDMLQLSGSVASIKDKDRARRSRTRCLQKPEIPLQPQQ